MKNRAILSEKDEEDQFRRFMQVVAEAEGARLFEENKRLMADDAFRVPHELDRKCRETIINDLGRTFNRIVNGSPRLTWRWASLSLQCKR